MDICMCMTIWWSMVNLPVTSFLQRNDSLCHSQERASQLRCEASWFLPTQFWNLNWLHLAQFRKTSPSLFVSASAISYTKGYFIALLSFLTSLILFSTMAIVVYTLQWHWCYILTISWSLPVNRTCYLYHNLHSWVMSISLFQILFIDFDATHIFF